MGIFYFNPLTLLILIDFTLSNTRRFCLSMGNPLGVKGLNSVLKQAFKTVIMCIKNIQSRSITS